MASPIDFNQGYVAPWSIMSATSSSKSAQLDPNQRPEFGAHTTINISPTGQKTVEYGRNPYSFAQDDRPQASMQYASNAQPRSNILNADFPVFDVISPASQSAASAANPVAENGLDQKLNEIPAKTGGVALNNLPTAAPVDSVSVETLPAIETVAPTKQTAALEAPVQNLQANTAEFKPLSKDVTQQLNHIRRLNGQAELSQAQNLASNNTASPAPAQTSPAVEQVATQISAASEGLSSKPQANTAAMAQIAAYESANAIQQNPYGEAQGQDHIANAMLSALQKYDELLNGRK